VRFSLPARGMDPRIAPLELSVHAKNLRELRANDAPVEATPLHADPWAAIELRGTAANSGEDSAVWKTSCGGRPCLHAYLAAPNAQPRAADIVLAFDASPSTEGSARSRLLVTTAALLAQAPNGSRIRALRFASQALPLLAQRKEPRELALTAFGPIAFEAELGAATRFESAWQLIEKWGFAKGAQRKLVVIIGDGGITTGPARPFDAARRAGVEVAVVNVADRPTQPALLERALATGGAIVDAGSEADATVRGAAADRLEERIAAIFQPSAGSVHVSGARGVPAQLGLRAGDSLTIDAPCAGNCSVQLGSRALRSNAAAALANAIALHTAQLLASPDPHGSLSAVDAADLNRGGDRPANQMLPAKRGVDCDRRGPAQRVSGLSSDAAPVDLAVERAVCALPVAQPKPREPDDEVGAGMPGSPLLSMLRQRIIPVARGCFRRDRAGRADYEVRAMFVFELAEREVISASVQGKIPEQLRSCLLEAVDTLSVPRFAGKVVVRYPLITEKEAVPSQIELTAETADRLDSVLTKP
jgi:hypothetical protein